MDMGSEELFSDKSYAKNFKPNSKIKIDQKGRTLSSERRNNA
jgi:hypothetical protein